MPATDSFENDIINHFMRGQAIGTSTVYIALSTTTPNEDGTNFTEPSTLDGYARQALSLDAPTTGSSLNSAQITFGPCTNNAWGTITYLGVFFQSSGGDLKLYKATSSRTIGVGGSLTFDIGILGITVD